jgi:hypothetical protein
LNEAGRISGRAQAAVRPISASNFNRIVSVGVEEHEFELPRITNDRSVGLAAPKGKIIDADDGQLIVLLDDTTTDHAQ